VLTDGALAAFIAGAVGLLGCRAVFVLCGTAGRGRLRNGRVSPPRGWDIGIEFLSPERRVFCRSLGGNVAFLARWLRAAMGWVLAWAISVLAAAIAAERIVGQTARPLARTWRETARVAKALKSVLSPEWLRQWWRQW
jgi:hypothetical protein